MTIFGCSLRALKTIPGVVFLAVLGLSGPAFAAKVDIRLQSNQSLDAGVESLREGNVKAAITYFEKALASTLSDQQLLLTHNGLCVAFNKTRNFEKALDHCNQAIELRSNFFAAHINRGNVFLAMKKFDEAIANYEAAKTHMPQSFIPQRNIDIALMIKGDSYPQNPTPPELVSDICDPDPYDQQMTLR